MSNRIIRRGFPVGLFCALLLTACATTSPRPAPHAEAAPASVTSHGSWLSDVTAISVNADNAGRRNAVQKLLSESGLVTTEQSFTDREFNGTNLLVDVAGDQAAPLLLIGAHLDKVDAGDGVTDNASGSAATLALARRFRDTPLRHHRVAVAFWDLEEKGLLGANAYVTGGGEKPALYVNFDVFGWGDTLWMMTPDPAHRLVTAAGAAAQAHGIAFSAGDRYPPTDHLAFLKAGWPAVSFSLVGADEIDSILKVFSGDKPAEMPKVMAVIHSGNDTLQQVDAAAVETGIDAVETALRAWDAAHAGE